ncbi:MAG: MT-A70 family methyltransferase [Acidiferrobacterales bacterium]
MLSENDCWALKLREVEEAINVLPGGQRHLPVRDASGRIDPLGRWLNAQRSLCRQGKLSPERRAAIEALGIDLSPARGRAASLAASSRSQDRHRHNPNRGIIAPSLESLVSDGRKFGVIYADPPWRYANQGTRGATSGHYQGMTIEEIIALPVEQLSADDCFLHLWTTNGFLKDAITILEAWGFEFKSNFIWTKPQMGMGNYWRVSHEILLLGKRGSPAWHAKGLHSWGTFPRRKHSAKPEEVRAMIERANPGGPYLELFARRTAPGWTVWGNQIEQDLVSRANLG